MNETKYFIDKLKKAPPIKWGKFKCFKITFSLGSPICVTTPWISFDGILSHLMFLDALGEDYFITPKKLDLSGYLPKNNRLVPLKKTGDIYHASVSIFNPDNLFVTRIYKRFETEGSENLKKKKIYQGSGYFRQYAICEPYKACKEAIFYAFGDIEIIEDLISKYLFYLGNDGRIGWGAIRKIKFSETDKDYSLVANGMAMRPIPVEMCDWYDDSAYLAYKSPYWNPKNIRLCVPPGAKCRLKNI